MTLILEFWKYFVKLDLKIDYPKFKKKIEQKKNLWFLILKNPKTIKNQIDEALEYKNNFNKSEVKMPDILRTVGYFLLHGEDTGNGCNTF